jgi:hypothetical protein
VSATLAEKVLGRLAGRAVRAGEMVEIGPDWTFALDDGIGLIDQNFRRYGVSAASCSSSSGCRANGCSTWAKASRTRSRWKAAWCDPARW